GLRAAEGAADRFVVPPHAGDPATLVVPAEHRRVFLDGLRNAGEDWSLLDPGDRGWPERRLPVTEMVALQQRAMTARLLLEPWPRGGDGRPSHLRGAGVAIEFWDRSSNGDLVAPRPNDFAAAVPAGAATTQVEVHGVP